MIIIGNNNKINDEEYEEPILEIDCNIISKLTNATKILFIFSFIIWTILFIVCAYESLITGDITNMLMCPLPPIYFNFNKNKKKEVKY